MCILLTPYDYIITASELVDVIFVQDSLGDAGHYILNMVNIDN